MSDIVARMMQEPSMYFTACICEGQVIEVGQRIPIALDLVLTLASRLDEFHKENSKEPVENQSQFTIVLPLSSFPDDISSLFRGAILLTSVHLDCDSIILMSKGSHLAAAYSYQVGYSLLCFYNPRKQECLRNSLLIKSLIAKACGLQSS
ncbi:hypothetical protein GMRT_23531 [Giardia muris]|uniref:Uncharacterized protein n=1 Tax=Giardia muris TaxID=5742 RepID=A0A4Z1T5X3_GIAMU|nr:hypothetical protein GMRT_23531 [Giardia muris]|eukprot:TNJ27919.1 hypothetical protein GMRT_23531 [Giardia muris]